jgi:hypothetical protein
MPRPIFRFAPSPNGYLHLGHALSALINFEMARESDGRLVLRIEDIDTTRCRPEYEEAIYEDLAWLGIAWEQPVRRQSQHFDDYRAALARLERTVSSIRASKAVPRLRRWSPHGSGTAAGRATPMGLRSIRAARPRFLRSSRSGAWRAGSHTRCGLT